MRCAGISTETNPEDILSDAKLYCSGLDPHSDRAARPSLTNLFIDTGFREVRKGPCFLCNLDIYRNDLRMVWIVWKRKKQIYH